MCTTDDLSESCGHIYIKTNIKENSNHVLRDNSLRLSDRNRSMWIHEKKMSLEWMENAL